MKYACLVLDHDDTVVNSTATIHFPAFMQAMEVLRPGFTMTLEEYFIYNFDPGFTALCEDILHFTPEETEYQSRNWERYVASHIPSVYEGIAPILHRFQQEGGHICVVSHSLKENILRDYEAGGLPRPELVFGWDLPPEHRKPYPWPLEQIMKALSLGPEELLMVDDLKPGKDMADACGVPFAAACWAHHIPSILQYMKENCSCCLSSTKELGEMLF